MHPLPEVIMSSSQLTTSYPPKIRCTSFIHSAHSRRSLTPHDSMTSHKVCCIAQYVYYSTSSMYLYRDQHIPPTLQGQTPTLQSSMPLRLASLVPRPFAPSFPAH